MSATTDLSPAVQGARAALAKGKTSLADVIVAARGAVLAASRKDVEWRPERPVPVLALEESEVQALLDLPKVIEGVRLPTTPRVLEDAEKRDVIRLKDAADAAKKAAEKAILAAKVSFFNHADEIAVQRGEVDDSTPITSEGWYVVEDKHSGSVAGEGKKPVREVKRGSVSLSAEDLKALVDSGDLEHDDYLALTRQVRVVDESRLAEVLQRKPHLIEVVDKAVKVGAPQASFTLRANK